MKLLVFIIFVGIGAISFYIGYEFGRKGADGARQPAPQIAEQPDSAPETAAETGAVPVEVPTVTKTAVIPVEPPEPMEPTPEGLAARAALPSVTLIDQQGRELVAEILEVREDALKVRRQADFRIVEVPIDMLSDPDRIFAEFLWQRKAERMVVEAEVPTVDRGPDITEKSLVQRIKQEF